MAALKPSAKKLKIISKTKLSPNAPKPVRAAPTSDPNAPLWNMLKEIPLTQSDRLSSEHDEARENKKDGKKVGLGKMQNGWKSYLLGLCKFVWNFANSHKCKTKNA